MRRTYLVLATVVIVVAVTVVIAISVLHATGRDGRLAATSATTPAASGVPTPTATPATTGAVQLFAGGMYLEPTTDASVQEKKLRDAGNIQAADIIHRIAAQPTAIWLGEWYSGALLRTKLAAAVAGARAQGTTPVFVTYAIPGRDCGGYSAGGLADSTYLAWTQAIADELKGAGAAVLVEPDSLSMLSATKCAAYATSRPALIRKAVAILSAAGVATYLDGGNARWHTPADQAAVLKSAGVADATGFFTNVSNFDALQNERDYAGKVSARIGDKHFVIDTSRDGAGWTGTWCNPPGARLGETPRAIGGTSKLDAVLWVKHPGTSDGTCNGGPAAGAWFASYALALAR